MMMWVLCHLVTEPVSQFQTDLRAEFFRILWKLVTELERSSNGEKVYEQWQDVQMWILKKNRLKYFCYPQNKWGSYPALIHRKLFKVVFSSRRSMVNEVSYQNVCGFSVKIFHIFGYVVHLITNTRFHCFDTRSPALISNTDSIF